MNIGEFRKEVCEIISELYSDKHLLFPDDELYGRIKNIKPIALDILVEHKNYINHMFKQIDMNLRVERYDMRKVMNYFLEKTENRKSIFFKILLRKITGDKIYNFSIELLRTIREGLKKIPNP